MACQSDQSDTENGPCVSPALGHLQSCCFLLGLLLPPQSVGSPHSPASGEHRHPRTDRHHELSLSGAGWEMSMSSLSLGRPGPVAADGFSIN